MSIRAASIIAVLALAMVGCGDAGLDLNELQARANRICKRADDQVRALPPPQSEAAIRANIRRAVSITRRAIGELEPLKPPAEVRDRYAKLLANLRAGLKLATERVNATLAGDDARGARAAQEGDRLTRANDDLTRAIGMRSCGSA